LAGRTRHGKKKKKGRKAWVDNTGGGTESRNITQPKFGKVGGKKEKRKKTMCNVTWGMGGFRCHRKKPWRPSQPAFGGGGLHCKKKGSMYTTESGLNFWGGGGIGES